MGEASQAFDDNQFDVAAAKYRAALAMRPQLAEALNGLAGLLTKQQQYTAAAGVYEQLIKVQPRLGGRLARTVSGLCARQPEPEGAGGRRRAFRPR